MSDRETLTLAVSVGMNAARLLNDELLRGLFASKKSHACEMFMLSSADDDKRRAELWRSVQGVISIERELQALVDSGTMAADSLKLLDERDQLQNANSAHNFLRQ
jgi:predicted lipoprotein